MSHIHQLPGRLRVRSAILKGNEQLASSALQVIVQLSGVTSASINTVTGSILVKYNVNLTHSAPIIRELNKLQILSGILGFPKPVPTLRLVAPLHSSQSQSSEAMAKSFLSELCLTAGKIFLLTLVEQSAASAARRLVFKML